MPRVLKHILEPCESRLVKVGRDQIQTEPLRLVGRDFVNGYEMIICATEALPGLPFVPGRFYQFYGLYSDLWQYCGDTTYCTHFVCWRAGATNLFEFASAAYTKKTLAILRDMALEQLNTIPVSMLLYNYQGHAYDIAGRKRSLTAQRWRDRSWFFYALWAAAHAVLGTGLPRDLARAICDLAWPLPPQQG